MNVRIQKRLAFGSVMIAAMVGVLVLDAWLTSDVYSPAGGGWIASPNAVWAVRAAPLTILVVGLILPALGEMKKFAAGAGVELLPVSGLIGSAALATLPFWWQFVPSGGPVGARAAMLIVSLVVCFVFAEQMARRTTRDALRRIACTLLAAFYLGIGGAIIMNIRLAYNVPVLVLFLAAVKFADIGAYFTGSAVGRHKLIPWLSPGKTWEGLVGGLIVAAGVSVLAAWALDVRLSDAPISLARAAIFGACVGLAGQFGDLAESLLKRSVNVKDSGAAVPEFGGVLDILDSPLLAAPAGYLLLTTMF